MDTECAHYGPKQSAGTGNRPATCAKAVKAPAGFALPCHLHLQANRIALQDALFFLPRCSAQWNGNPVACDLRSQSRRVQLRYEQRHVIFQPCPIQSNPTHRRLAKLHVARNQVYYYTMGACALRIRLSPKRRSRSLRARRVGGVLHKQTNKQRTSFVSLIQRVDLSYLIYIYQGISKQRFAKGEKGV